MPRNEAEERSHYACVSIGGIAHAHSHVVEGGVKAAGAGLAVFGVAAFAAARGRMTLWTHSTVPIRGAMVINQLPFA